jgi:hypothetical protein
MSRQSGHRFADKDMRQRVNLELAPGVAAAPAGFSHADPASRQRTRRATISTCAL